MRYWEQLLGKLGIGIVLITLFAKFYPWLKTTLGVLFFPILFLVCGIIITQVFVDRKYLFSLETRFIIGVFLCLPWIIYAPQFKKELIASFDSEKQIFYIVRLSYSQDYKSWESFCSTAPFKIRGRESDEDGKLRQRIALTKEQVQSLNKLKIYPQITSLDDLNCYCKDFKYFRAGGGEDEQKEKDKLDLEVETERLKMEVEENEQKK